ncbi:MAG: ABC transporter ATP-binding protein [Candidatus Caenarcaniphilales bacterium]|nr:ABC transporter ATP-binding protein [Candidatus Caenarcaniphilales bacterium]
MMIEKLIEVKDLEIYFKENDFTAVKSISFDLYEGEILALVGESGSGKSLTASSIIGLAPLNSQLKGQIYYKGEELYPNYPVKLRGHHIAMIPQDTLSALNPVFKVGEQVYEAVDIWRKDLSKTEKKNLVLKTFADVGIADPETCYEAYPHEISGGMRQRAMIAMAVINEPDVIIADEATTALDVTVQALILKLLKKLNKTILFITHDLGVVAEIADRVIVMKRGEILEENDVFGLFENPSHEYTRELLASIPRV